MGDIVSQVVTILFGVVMAMSFVYGVYTGINAS
ncbi:conserved hypothetical protein [Vibrio crassostreae]|nr:conserved hypothetical protein [Vibrio chagasii]CAH7438408.1 conserved hypothetical protein [Vibrio chagasii]CAK3973416.1 conserved hypothetical protein [Vibrio crassostreae]